MALETLKHIKTIDGFDVIVMDELQEKHPERFNEDGGMEWEWFETEIRPNYFIYLRHDKNSIALTMQNGPIKENGVNGCQVDTIIATALAIVKGLNAKFPSTYNEQAASHLTAAYNLMKDRKKDRESRGVEGKNEL